jgi:myo-inositol-1(or 4)-monophosphatase
MTSSTDHGELLSVAIQVAREAGRLARQYRAEGIGEVSTKSTATDLVTAADKAVERLIAKQLWEHRPDDEILGEEYGGAHQQSAEVRWVVDPIDGTVNYVYGLDQYAVSIAAQLEGESVVGVVLNAATGQEWTAVRGKGAWREGRRLWASTETELARSLVATGFGYAADRREHQAGVLARVLPRIRDIRRFGAASLDLCFAAEGRVDAYFEKGLNLWDHAAGGLVAKEAGLIVTGLRGQPPNPRMVVAAPPALHGPLHDLLVALAADEGP